MPLQDAMLAAAAAVGATAAGAFWARGWLRAKVVLSQLGQHVSIRKFEPRPVPDQLLQRLLQHGVRSSTSGNMQTYSVIVTTEPSALQRLANIHDNGAMARAPVVLTFCADWSRMARWCDLRGARPQYDNWMAFITGNNDAMVAAQTVAVAAEASGLGICFLGSTTWATPQLCDFFALPQHVHPVTSLMLGWPAETPAIRSRLPMDGIVHRERYAPLTDEAVLKAFKDREVEGWERYIKLYGPTWQEKIDRHKLENLPQVYTTLKYTGRDFRRWSRLMLGSIEGQGFGDNAFREGDDEPSPHNI